MHASSNALNLARKWRSRTFNEIVGQEMAISMLRNSLYKNHFFPVYLFAGQKGCGKTSTARILAAAANCEQLSTFQKDPSKTSIPCLECASCSSMYAGTHADFIEIDAASHTGVDDVRALLESCSFMPLMGSKKIYLIDEAHMLSKAAFNAFLKVLEEPPAQVLFMMATTELHKIPETVRSRCFQLHFNAIDRTLLHDHLTAICTAEKIDCTPEALTLILHETGGSARDAINLLEQVRFASETVTAVEVQKALGLVSPHRLGELFALMVEAQPTQLLTQVKEMNFGSLNATRLWQLLLDLVRTLIWQTYEVTPRDTSLILDAGLQERIYKAASTNRLHAILELLWQQEELFLATPYKHAFLEKVFLDICTQVNIRDLAELTAFVKQSGSAPAVGTTNDTPKPVVKPAARPAGTVPSPSIKTTPAPAPSSAPAPRPAPATASGSSQGWQAVCQGIAAQNDPILLSIFQQAAVQQVDQDTQTVVVKLASASPFFKEKINDAQAVWQPLVQKHFNCTTLKLTGAEAPPAPPKIKRDPIPVPDRAPMPSAPAPGAPPWQQRSAQKRPKLPARPKGTPLLINSENQDKWPQAQLLLAHFPGKLELLGDVQP